MMLCKLVEDPCLASMPDRSLGLVSRQAYCPVHVASNDLFPPQREEVEVAPLPEEILNSESTLLISSSEPEVHIKKKDRRRLRHEQWLESKFKGRSLVYTCTVLIPATTIKI